MRVTPNAFASFATEPKCKIADFVFIIHYNHACNSMSTLLSTLDTRPHIIIHMAPSKESLAQRLKRSRGESKLTQQQLADTAGVSAAAIGLIEIGDTKAIRSEHLFSLARALNKNPEWLATGKGIEHALASMDHLTEALRATDRIKVLEFVKYVITTAPTMRTNTPRAKYLEQIDKLTDAASRESQ